MAILWHDWYKACWILWGCYWTQSCRFNCLNLLCKMPIFMFLSTRWDNGPRVARRAALNRELVLSNKTCEGKYKMPSFAKLIHMVCKGLQSCIRNVSLRAGHCVRKISKPDRKNNYRRWREGIELWHKRVKVKLSTSKYCQLSWTFSLVWIGIYSRDA